MIWVAINSACWVILLALSSADFFSKLSFSKNSFRDMIRCQTVWIQIRPDKISDLLSWSGSKLNAMVISRQQISRQSEFLCLFNNRLMRIIHEHTLGCKFMPAFCFAVNDISCMHVEIVRIHYFSSIFFYLTLIQISTISVSYPLITVHLKDFPIRLF